VYRSLNSVIVVFYYRTCTFFWITATLSTAVLRTRPLLTFNFSPRRRPRRTPTLARRDWTPRARSNTAAPRPIRARHQEEAVSPRSTDFDLRRCRGGGRSGVLARDVACHATSDGGVSTAVRTCPSGRHADALCHGAQRRTSVCGPDPWTHRI
jgi:hypothetical protein